MKEGMKERRKEGRKEGRKERRKDGRERKQGRKEGSEEGNIFLPYPSLPSFLPSFLLPSFLDSLPPVLACLLASFLPSFLPSLCLALLSSFVLFLPAFLPSFLRSFLPYSCYCVTTSNISTLQLFTLLFFCSCVPSLSSPALCFHHSIALLLSLHLQCLNYDLICHRIARTRLNMLSKGHVCGEKCFQTFGILYVQPQAATYFQGC